MGALGQANDANAAANATGATTDPNAAPPQSNATATQTAPGNVSVVIRVNSPGDNGTVNQTNAVGANANTPASDLPANGTGATDPNPTTDQLVTTSGSSAAGNISGSDQSVDQSNNITAPDAPTTISSSTAPVMQSTVGTATANQINPANMNVSVRIGSDGTDGAVTQSSIATAAGTSPDLGIVNVTGGTNTNVSIVIPGVANGAPTSGAWQWNWAWDGSWTLPANATASDVAPTADAIWNWVWSAQPGATAPTPSTTPVSGTWTWNWTWTRTDGQTWTWTWTQACSCNWTWNWNWDWSKGMPSASGASTSQAPPVTGGADIGAVTQTNQVTSEALATASIDSGNSLTQIAVADPTTITSDSDPSLASGFTAQTLLSAAQVSWAIAKATQNHAFNSNIIWGVASQPVTQSNTVDAAAQSTVDLETGQAIGQGQFVGDGSTNSVSANQSLSSSQVGVATATSTQDTSGNLNVAAAPDANQATIGSVDQENSASSLAAVASFGIFSQSIGQIEDIGTASVQSDTATQEISSSQLSGAEADVSQLHTWNVNWVIVPAGSRATNPTLRQRNIVYTESLAGNAAVGYQTITQGSGGVSDGQSNDALQLFELDQSALAYSPAYQQDLLNIAHWLGIEPPLPVPPAPAPPALPAAPAPVVAALSAIGSQGAGLIGSYRLPVLPSGLTVGGVSIIVKHHKGGSGSGGSSSTQHSTVAPSGSETVLSGCAADCAPFSTSTATTRNLLVTVVDRQHTRKHASAEGSGPSPSCSCSGAPGSAGAAPAGGSGASALAVEPYRFAAPAQLRPQYPASVLGRPVAFLDPFERPG